MDLPCLVTVMEFSAIGAEDSLEEAKLRLESVDALIVWGGENILGVLTLEHISQNGNCGASCELDILVDPTPQYSQKWKPKFIVMTDEGEPVLLSRGP
tara:strand:- start:164 stop:457 length:294 start_codon:yes stop_codon:yes gene_type:complete